jgi:hypothetical protein
MIIGKMVQIWFIHLDGVKNHEKQPNGSHQQHQAKTQGHGFSQGSGTPENTYQPFEK